MIEGARQFVKAMLTPAAVNAQIDLQNTRFANVPGWVNVQHVDATTGVQDMWAKAFRDLPRPGIGYLISALADGDSELLVEGKSRMTVPVWVDYSCPGNVDKETALQHIGVTAAAILRVFESMESNNLGTVLGVTITPNVQLANIKPSVLMQPVSLGAQEAGQQLGVRMRFDLVIDDLRS